MDLFDNFKTTEYTFLELKSDVNGMTIVSETDATGIVKLRDSKTNSGDVTTGTSDASLHIRPNEPFVAGLGGYFVGHGVRVGLGGQTATTYQIVAQSDGFDYDTNQMAFYNLDLQRLDLASWETATLPLT